MLSRVTPAGRAAGSCRPRERSDRPRRPPRRGGLAGGPGRRASRSATPTRGSRRPSAPSCACSSTTTRSTSARGCTTGEPGADRRGSSRAATRSPRPTASRSTSTRTTTAAPASSSQVSAAGVQRDAAIYNDTSRTTRGTRCGTSAARVDDEGWTRGDADPVLAAPLPAGDRPRLGRQRRARHPAQERELAGSRSCRRTRAASPRAWPTSGHRRRRPRTHLELLPYVVGRAEYIARGRGRPLQRRLAALRRRRGSTCKYGVDEQPHPRRHRQPRLRPGRGRPGGREPHRRSRPSSRRSGRSSSRARRSSTTSAAAARTTTRRSSARSPTSSTRGASAARRRAAARPTSWTRPRATTILGAAKLTGARARGWSVGLLEAVTGREQARVARRRALATGVEVEPLTQLLRGPRAAATWARARVVGLLGTAVEPRPRRPRARRQLAELAPTSAASTARLPRRDDATGWCPAGSPASHGLGRAGGDAARCSGAPPRYYQRPDAPAVARRPGAHVALAAGRAALDLNRTAGNVHVNAGLWGISPGFESNDLGFATQTDRGGGHGQVVLRKLDAGPRGPAPGGSPSPSGGPSTSAARARATACRRSAVVAAPELLAGSTSAARQLAGATLDDKLTRGGPTVIRPGIESCSVVARERHPPPGLVGRASPTSRQRVRQLAARTSAALDSGRRRP